MAGKYTPLEHYLRDLPESQRNFLLAALFLASFLLSACAAPAPGEAWTAYHAARDTLVNPNYPAYRFEYPAYWEMEEDVNHISFVSEQKLFKDVPEKLEAGQIIVGLSMNINMSPQEMVETSTAHLESIIQFEEIASVRWNGHAAAYRKGKAYK